MVLYVVYLVTLGVGGMTLRLYILLLAIFIEWCRVHLMCVDVLHCVMNFCLKIGNSHGACACNEAIVLGFTC